MNPVLQYHVWDSKRRNLPITIHIKRMPWHTQCQFLTTRPNSHLTLDDLWQFWQTHLIEIIVHFRHRAVKRFQRVGRRKLRFIATRLANPSLPTLVASKLLAQYLPSTAVCHRRSIQIVFPSPQEVLKHNFSDDSERPLACLCVLDMLLCNRRGWQIAFSQDKCWC